MKPILSTQACGITARQKRKSETAKATNPKINMKFSTFIKLVLHDDLKVGLRFYMTIDWWAG